jgi:Inner membrane protein YgaP-like, transmembrane domain
MTTSTTPHADKATPAWRTINISPAERLGRVVLGLAAVIAGLVLLTAAGSVLAVVLQVLLTLASLDLLITGALGHCPLYAKLGHVPRSLRSPR